jgi:hypothetical protein
MERRLTMSPTVKIAILIGCLSLAFFAGRAFLHSEPSATPTLPGSTKGFAVVELFTSEGCSSCPPADRLVAKIQQEDKDQPVFILVWHVDYWDRLGWKDAFSDARYTRRQQGYAAWLNLQSIYTPEIVVNGQKEFVGSEETTLRGAIRSALQQTPPAHVEIDNARIDQGKIDWSVKVDDAGPNTTLEVALVQRAATTEVKAGENSGHTLAHIQIVREAAVADINSNGAVSGSLRLPPGLSPGEEEIIAFVQNTRTGQITGAARAAIH